MDFRPVEPIAWRVDCTKTSVSILFVGYLLMQGRSSTPIGAVWRAYTREVPSNMILNKFGKPSIYLPGCMLAWGIISTCTAATKSYGGLLACRFILGFVEAAYFVRAPFFLKITYTDVYSPAVSIYFRHGIHAKSS